jgi:hypothetical protein
MNYSEIGGSDFPRRSLQNPFRCIGMEVAMLSLRREQLSPGGTEASDADDCKPLFTIRVRRTGIGAVGRWRG